MIDPFNITEYNCTTERLEEILLFSCCVAGKNALTTARCLEQFLCNCRCLIKDESPFNLLRKMYNTFGCNFVVKQLEYAGIGCYNNRARTFQELVNKNIDLKTCSAEELEEVWGIGRKTSRFFILHTRPNVEVAVLDTHIMKYLRSLDITKLTKPPGTKTKYLELEEKFITLAKQSGKTIAEFDLYLWSKYASR